MSKSVLEELFAAQIPDWMETPTREYRFHPTRRWRFDFAWPDILLAVEIHGGLFVSGRHNRGLGMQQDFKKHNEAVLLGWRVLQFSGHDIRKNKAIDFLKQFWIQESEKKS